jgi:hypothetical protein
MNSVKISLGSIGRFLALVSLSAALAACNQSGSSSASDASAATVGTAGTSGGGSSSSSSSSGGSSSSSGATSSSSGGTSSSSSGTSSSGGSSSSGSSSGSSSSSSSSGSNPKTQSVTLSWAAPTENTDGTALTNLAGFDIYYGTTASSLTQKISVNTVGLLTYVVENLTSGTWYFEVVAVNASGVQSGPSSVVNVTI